MNIYDVEQEKLIETLQMIDEQLHSLEQVPVYYGEDLTEQVLESVRKNSRQRLRIAANESYFARLDFQEEHQKDSTPIYIGKVGVSDEETQQPLVIDWRAPVASMFYSFTGGDEMAFYDSPEGMVEGYVHLKRNIAIRKREIERVVDTYIKGSEDLSLSDDFLLYRLGENKDNKLKDIVSTIQAEQNDIIRAEKNAPLIIQGVAGSGKTTVALHRLAYLIYEYREQVKAERMIIFAPNSVFLDYISNVLPELGVGDIAQTTFQDWVIQLLDHSVSLRSSEKQLLQQFSIHQQKDEMQAGQLKGSLTFQRYIDESLTQFEQEILPMKDFEAWEFSILQASVIKEWMKEYEHYPLVKRRERVVARIKRWIEIELKEVGDANRRKQLKKQATSRLTSYLKSWPKVNAMTYYSSLMQKESLEKVLPVEVINETGKNCRKKEVMLEDLAPLAYIYFKLEGIQPSQKFHHVVIDEAQDFSPFQLAVLKDVTIGNSFTILGDLSQAIYNYYGIDDWNYFRSLFPQDVHYFELTRSYRSTMEIIYFANEVIKTANIPVSLATPVFRSGEAVKVMKADNQIESLLKEIRRLQQKDTKTIAIIGRTAAECATIYESMQEIGIEASLIESKNFTYTGGISIVPVYLAKGLEFDSVLVIDVDSLHYTKTVQDARLLYVACTRSLHELTLFYTDKMSPLIEQIDTSLYENK
ncbi:DNA helicase-2/ATP-dependent DNA helicase PcrA [Priestia taiwanensis]|uniref:DNA 3'-5' helicase n=2 Tax=Priestia taiwanensis TaxID=1347902 RepID=A0A917AMQ6_9BACI|nr:UvrD-helicase domain-containing protein [Priestia taiwanensis]MBM7362408.1 DNA helicase-2/ATP-dependent DNA helicase PcrA [Priestia taiwanensis]GGE62011.1 DNA helicase [Priestia taiwanensis]